MINLLGDFFTRLGISRDAIGWLWLQLAAGAAIVLTGVFDVHRWMLDYVGYDMSAREVRWFMLLCGAIVWLSGRMATSPLWSSGHMVMQSFAEKSGRGTGDGIGKGPIGVGAWLLVPMLLLGGLSLPACVHKAPTPVAAVADTATRLETTTDAIVLAAKKAHATVNPATGLPLVTTDQLVTVALAGDKIGRLGTDLGSLLRQYAAAKAAGKDLMLLQAQIRAIVDTTTQALADVGKAVPKGIVADIDSAIATGFSIVAQIQLSAGL